MFFRFFPNLIGPRASGEAPLLSLCYYIYLCLQLLLYPFLPIDILLSQHPAASAYTV